MKFTLFCTSNIDLDPTMFLVLPHCRAGGSLLLVGFAVKFWFLLLNGWWVEAGPGQFALDCMAVGL